LTERTGRHPGLEYKMVLVLRGELRLTSGKAAVQAAHAAVMLVDRARAQHSPDLSPWQAQGGKKIALVAPDLTAMMQLERQAKARGIPTTWVEDAGLTEVPPGTRTCLGLGPSPARDIDAVTGSLPLL
jgi:peptidyl-tRNA hydrolase, PTH2 family